MRKLLFLLLLLPTLGFAQIQPGGEYYVEALNNDEIRSLVEQIDRQIYEIYNSQSSRVESIKPADLRRITRFNDNITRYRDWMVDPTREDDDYVHSHPHRWPVAYVTEDIHQPMFNQGLRDLIVKYVKLSIELSSSHSALNATGLDQPDLERFDGTMSAIRKFLSEYIEPSYPIDKPENTRNIGGSPDLPE